MVAVPVDYDREQQRGKTDGLDDGNQRIVAEITHDRPVHAKTNKQGNCHNRRTDKQPTMLLHWIDQIIDPKAHDKCHP
ncbi:hypothetical protein D9M71_724270 [compost metagenome]